MHSSVGQSAWQLTQQLMHATPCVCCTHPTPHLQDRLNNVLPTKLDLRVLYLHQAGRRAAAAMTHTFAGCRRGGAGEGWDAKRHSQARDQEGDAWNTRPLSSRGTAPAQPRHSTPATRCGRWAARTSRAPPQCPGSPAHSGGRHGRRGSRHQPAVGWAGHGTDPNYPAHVSGKAAQPANMQGMAASGWLPAGQCTQQLSAPRGQTRHPARCAPAR